MKTKDSRTNYYVIGVLAVSKKKKKRFPLRTSVHNILK